MRCAGSLAMEAPLPDSSSAFAEEGTLAHSLAAECLINHCDVVSFVAASCSKGGGPFPPEMVVEVQKYLDLVGRIAQGGELLVEQRLEFSRFVCVPDQFGTSDAVVLLGDELIVIDLKYGRGVKVEAEDNEQLQLYALGALDTFGGLADFKRVRMVIHQPRLDHVSEWVISTPELLEFGERAGIAARKAISISPVEATLHLTPGEDQCRFCKAKGICPALRDQVLNTIAGDFGAIANTSIETFIELGKGEVAVTITEAERIIAAAHGVAAKSVDFVAGTTMNGDNHFVIKKPALRPVLEQADAGIPASDPDHLAVLLDSVDLIEGWCKSVRAEAERRLLAGVSVPGYKLVEGRAGNRAWTDEVEAEKLLKSFRLKQEEMYDFKLISPTSAQKVLAASPKRWTKAAALITRNDGKPSVAPAGDKRPALVKLPVADDFENVADTSDKV